MHTSRTVRVLLLSSGTAITQLITLATLAVLTRVLTIQDLATYRQMLLVIQTLTPLLTLGIPSALYYFLPRHAATERTVLASTLLPMSALALLPALLLMTDVRHHVAAWFNNAALGTPLLYLSIYPLLALPTFALEPILLTKNLITPLILYTVATRTSLALGIIGVAALTPTPHHLALVHVVVAALSLGLALPLITSACTTGSLTPNLTMSKAVLKYSLPLGLASLAGLMAPSIGGVVVAASCPPEEFALYSLGAIEVPLLALITGAITTILRTDFIKLIHANQLADALDLLHRSARYSAALLLPLMVFLLLAARPLFEILFTSTYVGAALPFTILLFGLPIRVIYWNPLLSAFGRTREVLLSTIGGLLVYTTLAVCLVRPLGYPGPALGFVLALYIWTLPYNSSQLARCFNQPWYKLLPFRSLGKIAAASLAAASVPAGILSVYSVPTVPSLLLLTALYWPLVILALKLVGELPLAHIYALLRPKVPPLNSDRG